LWKSPAGKNPETLRIRDGEKLKALKTNNLTRMHKILCKPYLGQ